MTKPFFDEKLLRTDSSGNYQSFTGAKRVRFFEDRVELGNVPIHYSYVARLFADGNVLHVGYRVADGTVVEEYLRYDALTTGRAARALGEAVARALGHRAKVPSSIVEAASAQVARAPVLARAQVAPDGRTAVEVRDPEILFPLECPHCGAEASSVDLLYVSRGLSHKSAWLVPVCGRHPRLEDSIRVTRWAALVSGAEFSFSNQAYAERFRALNQGDAPGAGRSTSRLRWEVDRGTRFVVFQVAFSALYVSVITTSKVYKIPPGESTARRGLPYTMLSAVLGWWALPGPIFTIRAIRTNLRGGADLTDSVRHLAAGSRASARQMG
ncbi:MAG TPA: hypothetical protein VLQ45_28990 [Thermoanaerobaculia bacterium]|nr:hypothetical protein [Thermoanaerobaculia bacterium]